MTFWLRIFSDLIPFFMSVALIVAGAYCPLICRSEKVLFCYVLGVVAFSIVFGLIWVRV